MQGSIYACLFSTGLIKVGRSIDPIGRMASHADRLSCAGIELTLTHAAHCVSDVVMSERALIEKCTKSCSNKFHEEWFEGLDFDLVIAFISEISSTEFITETINKRDSVIDKAISTVGSLSALSELLGESPQTVSNWRSRQVPADRCPSIERATHGAVRCEELRPDVYWAYLRGTKKKAA